MTLHRAYHVRVENLERSIEFYRTVLGIRPSGRPLANAFVGYGEEARSQAGTWAQLGHAIL